MDCIVHEVAKSQTQLSNFHFTLQCFTDMIYLHLKKGIKQREIYLPQTARLLTKSWLSEPLLQLIN